jgi:hypothetical protein
VGCWQQPERGSVRCTLAARHVAHEATRWSLTRVIWVALRCWLCLAAKEQQDRDRQEAVGKGELHLDQALQEEYQRLKDEARVRTATMDQQRTALAATQKVASQLLVLHERPGLPLTGGGGGGCCGHD